MSGAADKKAASSSSRSVLVRASSPSSLLFSLAAAASLLLLLQSKGAEAAPSPAAAADGTLQGLGLRGFLGSSVRQARSPKQVSMFRLKKSLDDEEDGEEEVSKRMSMMRLKRPSFMRLKKPSFMRLRRGPSMMRLKKMTTMRLKKNSEGALAPLQEQEEAEGEEPCILWLEGRCLTKEEIELIQLMSEGDAF